jgi:tRNA nucleotidyltransferase/poly(A) polymerase
MKYLAHKLCIKNDVRQFLKIYVPEDILDLKEIFKRGGYQLYMVGGCVRDSLLGDLIKDYDLATDALPDDVETLLNSNGFKTLATGKSFGVINVFTKNNEYEIASFRSDLTKGRHPAVKFTNINSDAKRRDISINALYYDIDAECVIDLVGGMHDLKNSMVRTVGPALDRFKEDPLRVLRCIRFAARFNSIIDKSVNKALKTPINLNEVSAERIKEEFIKGIESAKDVRNYLGLLSEYNLFKWVFPGLKIYHNFFDDKDYIFIVACLLKNNHHSILKKWLIEHKYSRSESKVITFLVSLQTLSPDTAFKLKSSQNGVNVTDEQIIKFCNLGYVQHNMVKAFTKYELSVDGDEVKNNFSLKEGRELGLKIAEIEKQEFLSLIH